MPSEYQKTLSSIKKLKVEAKKLAKEAIKEGLTELFAEHPEVVAVRWRQYTPSFNDGDPCTFSCHASYCELSFKDKGNEDEETDFTEYGDTDSEKLAVDAFQEFLGGFDEDDMQAIYGDGVEVTVHSNGKVEKDEYYD